MSKSFSYTTPFLCSFVNEIREAQPNSDDIRELYLKDLEENDQERFSVTETRVLILSTHGDLESDLIGLILLSKGVDYLRINVEDIPNDIQISIHGEDEVKITIKNQVVILSKIQVVFVRHFDDNNIKFESDTAFINKFIQEQWLHIFRIIKEGASNARWLSSFDIIERLRYNKITQLSIAKTIGMFEVPDTLITNNSNHARMFYYSHGGNIVAKCLHHHLLQIKKSEYLIYTRKVLENDLSKIDESLALAPCIFQKKIEKKSELRITVVGEMVFAAKLVLKTKRASEEDIHLCKFGDDMDIEPFDLTQDLNNRIVKLMRVFDLQFGTLDFIIDTDNRLIFLEVNPTGDWAYIEDVTGMPITEALSKLIIENIKP